MTVVLLAAGASRRMGRPKQLLEIGGRPLVRRAVDAALASAADDVVLVTGHEAEAVRAAAGSEGFRCIENRAWSSGLASSIRLGVEEAADSAACVLAVVDQPALSPAVLDQLIAALDAGASLAACRYGDGTIGTPAAFAAVHFPDLLALRGDAGAGALLRAAEPSLVAFADGHLDIDTPADLARARAGAAR